MSPHTPLPTDRRPRAPVLIVEDHHDTAEMLRRFLTRRGQPADIAEDAATALAKLQTQRPSCLLLDESIPGMTGLQLLRTLRQHPEYQSLPAVFYSAHHDADKQAAAQALGAAWFIKGISRLEDLNAHIAAY
jgi:CheY-like chemotaxis protein